eukprot:COSAG03_NODE_52_length_16230_cov_22.987168_20_plen_110_part_00
MGLPTAVQAVRQSSTHPRAGPGAAASLGRRRGRGTDPSWSLASGGGDGRRDDGTGAWRHATRTPAGGGRRAPSVNEKCNITIQSQFIFVKKKDKRLHVNTLLSSGYKWC